MPRDWYHTDWVADRTIALARLARRRRRLVLLDELPRPAPPVGPAASRRWAASTGATCRCPRATRSRAAEREAILDAKPRHWRLWYDGTLVSNYEAPRRVGAGDADRRPGARGERPQRGRVRADRRGTRSRAGARSTARGLGRRRRRRLHAPTTASCRATSACCSRGRTTSTRSMRLPLVWRPAPSAGVAPAVVTRRSGSSTSRRRSARSPGLDAPDVDAGRAAARRRRGRVARGSSECSPSGTASCSASTSTCARSPATGWVCTAYRPGTVHDGTEGELYDLVDDPLQQHNRWDDPAQPIAARRPPRRPLGQPAPAPRAAPPARSARLTSLFVRFFPARNAGYHRQNGSGDEHAGPPWHGSSTSVTTSSPG